jgi:hypothetical protein
MTRISRCGKQEDDDVEGAIRLGMNAMATVCIVNFYREAHSETCVVLFSLVKCHNAHVTTLVGMEVAR